MDASVLKIVGQVAGIGGIALGVLLLVFRDVISKNIFPRLPSKDAYRLLRLIVGAVWSIAIVGVAAWVYTAGVASSPIASTTGDKSPVIQNGTGNATITIK